MGGAVDTVGHVCGAHGCCRAYGDQQPALSYGPLIGPESGGIYMSHTNEGEVTTVRPLDERVQVRVAQSSSGDTWVTFDITQRLGATPAEIDAALDQAETMRDATLQRIWPRPAGPANAAEDAALD